MSRPEWLPAKLRPEGTWEEQLAVGYRRFRNDFEAKPCHVDSLALVPSRQIGGLRVEWNSRRVRLGQRGEDYPSAFWHLVSDEAGQPADRLFNRERYEILPWCASVIANCCDPLVTVFDHLEDNGSVRTYLWLQARSITQ